MDNIGLYNTYTVIYVYVQFGRRAQRFGVYCRQIADAIGSIARHTHDVIRTTTDPRIRVQLPRTQQPGRAAVV